MGYAGEILVMNVYKKINWAKFEQQESRSVRLLQPKFPVVKKYYVNMLDVKTRKVQLACLPQCMICNLLEQGLPFWKRIPKKWWRAITKLWRKIF